MRVMPGILSQADVRYLPIVAAFVKKIGVAEEVDRLCAMESDVSPGLVTSAMILDTLLGRSPLYRFERFITACYFLPQKGRYEYPHSVTSLCRLRPSPTECPRTSV
jgi:hypothetical protein